jgi:hypothetical protein
MAGSDQFQQFVIALRKRRAREFFKALFKLWFRHDALFSVMVRKGSII